jgi:alpha-galactosidase
LDFEELDAKTFADWGVDYLKYDYCNAPEDVSTAFARYKKMGDALNATGRPIVYAICEWGRRKPWLWAKAAGGNLWRTTWDLRDVWQSNNKDLTGIMEVFDQQEKLAPYAGPGGWNDPDMLMVGLYGKGSSSNAGNNGIGCTKEEYQTHFALWCMLSAPLIVNSDLYNLPVEMLQLLTNKELISIDQDKLGKQAVTIYKNNGMQVLKKELANGDVAICIFNRNKDPQSGALSLQKDLDIWQSFSSAKAIFQNKIISKPGKLNYNLGIHACEVFRLTQ